MSFHGIHQRTVLPNGVGHSITCSFTGKGDINLILGRTSILQIYTLKADPNKNEENMENAKLHLVFEKSMFGVIESMASVRLPNGTTDSLILTFGEAKATILDWDSLNHDVRIVSFHFYEFSEGIRYGQEEDLKGGYTQFINKHSTVVDYENRCACIMLYDRNLSIIPFSSKTHSLYEEYNMDDVEFSDINEEEKSINSYTIHLPSLGIKNVKDFKFLHGYYEPTLMVLYEPVGAWVGRLSERRNTHHVAILSLNLEQQQHHLIWTTSNLPHDCYQILPLKSPGGACILSPNAIMYLNQSSRYKLVLNLFGDEDGQDPLALKFNCEESPIVISLDNAQTTFLHDYAVLVSIQSGELFVMNLISDGRSIVHINLQKLGTSINASCMCTLSHRYLFVGSKFEDSVLIKYFPKKEGQSQGRKKRKELPKDETKKKDMLVESSGVEQIAYDFIDPEDMDDDVLELVQTMLTSKALSRREKVKKTRWVMNVIDSIVCTSPISDLQVKKSINDNEQGDVNIDLIGCCGYGTGGSVGVFRQGIRPFETISFELYGCEAMWTLKDVSSTSSNNRKRKALDHNEADDHANGVKDHVLQNYILISKEEGSNIFETGEELIEKTMKIPIERNKMTLNAGNIFFDECILQVHSDGFIVIDGDKRIQEEELEVEIAWSYILDPYVAFLLNNHEIVLYKASYKERKMVQVPLSDHWVFPIDKRVATFCLFQDTSLCEGFNTKTTIQSNAMDIEDHENGKEHLGIRKRPYYMALVSTTGDLKIMDLETFQCVLQCSGIHNGRLYIEHEVNLERYWKDMVVSTDIIEALPKVIEIKMINLGSPYKPPYLFLLLENGDILVYTGFSIQSSRDHLAPVRFKRILSEPLLFFSSKNRDNHAIDVDEDDVLLRTRFPRMVPFSNINQKSGIFICGKTPTWIISERDFLRVFEMINQGPITSFAPIDNTSYSHGYVFYSPITSVINFSLLDPRWNLELPSDGITVYKAPIRATPTSMVYWPEEDVIVVMVAKKQKDMVRYLIGGADDRKDKDLADFIAEGNDPPVYDVDEVDPRYPVITEPKYEMLVLNGRTYEIEDSFKLKDEECGVVKRIYLKYSSDRSQRLNPFIAVGGSTMRGEDTLSKGRVALFDIGKKNRTQEDGTVATFSSLSQRCSKDFRYAVTEIDSVGGVLSVAVGHRIYLLTITTTSDLVEIAFVDTQIFTVSMCTIKNYILCGDIRRSISLLRWREDERTLLPLGKDYGTLSVYSTGMLVDKKKLFLLASDDRGNVFFYEYIRSIETHAGQKLLCVGEFHMGTQVKKFIRLKTHEDNYASYCAVYCGIDGSVGFINPMGRDAFRRLGKLEMRLVSSIPHFAGLNPKAFRLTKVKHMYQNHKRSVLDGELLKQFSTLERTKQDEISRLIGSSRRMIIEDLYSFEEAKKIFE